MTHNRSTPHYGPKVLTGSTDIEAAYMRPRPYVPELCTSCGRGHLRDTDGWNECDYCDYAEEIPSFGMTDDEIEDARAKRVGQ